MRAQLRRYGRVSKNVHIKEAKKVQKLWDIYNSYWNEKTNNPSGFRTFIWAFWWIVNRAFTDIFYKEISASNMLYIREGDILSPVEFKKSGNNKVEIIFTLRSNKRVSN